MDNVETELYRKHTATQERRAYFLLAASGAAIAFAVTQTGQASWSGPMWLWVAAILLWALSFFFGIRHMTYVGAATFANMDLVQIQKGEHPEYGGHPLALDFVREHIRDTSGRSSRSARLQFGFLVVGGATYMAWHILEMCLRILPHSSQLDGILAVTLS